VLATLRRAGLVERRPHPTHGRILQVTLTPEGERRLREATPAVRALEDAIEEQMAPEQVAAVKGWLVSSARRLQQIGRSR
jgi:DNA-binding MarR family transcriptional regulator